MTQGKTHREPLLRIAKRDGIARPKAWAIRIIAVLLSLVVSGIFIFAVTKLNPFQVYEGIFDGAFGTPRRSWVTVRDAMMLLCIGVGLAPAFKMRFWNIGAEGQILIGGIVTAGFMRALPAWARPRSAAPSQGHWGASSSASPSAECATRQKSAGIGARTSEPCRAASFRR